MNRMKNVVDEIVKKTDEEKSIKSGISEDSEFNLSATDSMKDVENLVDICKDMKVTDIIMSTGRKIYLKNLYKELRYKKRKLELLLKIVENCRKECAQELEETIKNINILLFLYNSPSQFKAYISFHEKLEIRVNVSLPASLYAFKDANRELHKYNGNQLINLVNQLESDAIEGEETLAYIDNTLESVRNKLHLIKYSIVNVYNTIVRVNTRKRVEDFERRILRKQNKQIEAEKETTHKYVKYSIVITVLLLELVALILFIYFMLFY